MRPATMTDYVMLHYDSDRGKRFLLLLSASTTS